MIARTAVFIRPGNLPHADGLLAGLGCEVDEAGFVTVDGTGRTSAPGVWAAGNVVDPRAQVITAAGAGSAAAIAINADLVEKTSNARCQRTPRLTSTIDDPKGLRMTNKTENPPDRPRRPASTNSP